MWKGVFSDFEKQAEELSVKHNVKLEVGERNVGVFEGTFEPSYTLHVRGTPERVKGFATELGTQWSQKAIVEFRPDSNGKDLDLRYPPGDHPDDFYEALHRAMGDEAGATFDGDQWRVYVDGGNTDTIRRVLKATEKFPKPRLAHGKTACMSNSAKARADNVVDMDDRNLSPAQRVAVEEFGLEEISPEEYESERDSWRLSFTPAAKRPEQKPSAKSS